MNRLMALTMALSGVLENLYRNRLAKVSIWLRALAVAGASVAVSLPAMAATIDVPGAKLTEVVGINNAGTVVGVYTDTLNVSHSFIDMGGTYTTIDDPAANAGTTQATGINNPGAVVGNYLSGAAYHGFERSSGGVFTPINYPGANTSGTLVFGINDNGDLAGQFSVTGGSYVQSFLYLKAINQYIIVSDPLAGTGAGQGTAATGVNNSDQVVGTYKDSSGMHGFLESGGVFTPLNDPSAVPGGTDAVGINNNGMVVGYFLDSSGHYDGFTELNGVYTTVDDPNPAAVNTQLFGINDSGQGAGIWADSSGNINGLSIPTSVPEPAALSLFGIGLTIAGVARLRRYRRKSTR